VYRYTLKRGEIKLGTGLVDIDDPTKTELTIEQVKSRLIVAQLIPVAVELLDKDGQPIAQLSAGYSADIAEKIASVRLVTEGAVTKAPGPIDPFLL